MGVARHPGVQRWRAGAAVAALCCLAGPQPIFAASDDGVLDPTIPTSVTLVSSSNPSFAGGSVTFTAGMIATPISFFPAGTVAFVDGNTALSNCSAVPVVSLGLSGLQHVGVAACTVALDAGVHSIRASYSGNAFNLPADSAILSQQVVVVAAQVTTTTLSSDLNPSTPGANVVLVAEVENLIAPAPGGHVHFTSDGVPIAACTARPLSNAGGGTSAFASCATDSVPAGNHTIVATYSGDGGNLASVSPDFVQSVTSPDACAPFNDV